MIDGNTQGALADALEEAFPTEESRKRALLHACNINLGNYRNLTEAIQEIAAKGDEVCKDCVGKLLARNPTNPKLRAFADSLSNSMASNHDALPPSSILIHQVTPTRSRKRRIAAITTAALIILGLAFYIYKSQVNNPRSKMSEQLLHRTVAKITVIYQDLEVLELSLQFDEQLPNDTGWMYWQDETAQLLTNPDIENGEPTDTLRSRINLKQSKFTKEDLKLSLDGQHVEIDLNDF